MTNSLRVVLGLMGLSLLGLAITGDQIYSRLSYFWLLIVLGNWVWSKFSLVEVTLKRSTRTPRGELGQLFVEKFELKNKRKLPILILSIEDKTDLPGSNGSRVHTLIGGNQGRSYLSRTRLSRRGVFELGPTTISSGDPFGFFPVKFQVPSQDKLMVYPLMEEVNSFPNPPGLLAGGESLRRRTHQITPNASGIREYSPEDGLNRIHWKSTARLDRLMVKEFELDPLAEAWIFLDGQSDAHYRIPYTLPVRMIESVFQQSKKFEIDPSTEEYSATIGASLARYYLSLGRAVGLAIGRNSLEELSPDRGGRQLDKILEALALFKADGNIPFEGTLAAHARSLPRGSTIVIITPSVNQDLPLAIDQFLRLGLKPIVILLESKSFNGLPGTAVLAEKISIFGVPVVTISKGDDIGETLSLAGENKDIMNLPSAVLENNQSRITNRELRF